jgi:hypothetical protein
MRRVFGGVSAAPDCVLTKSQAECLIALQHGKASKAEIAIVTKLDLLKTNEALHILKGLGLAKQDRTTA